MNKMSESQLQVAVANHLATRYPNVLFHSDFGSGVKLTARQAAVQSRQNAGRRGWPDLFIAASRRLFPESEKWICGLFIELKAEGVRIYKRNGDYASKHIAEQGKVLNALLEEGYLGVFCCGFDEAVKAIDYYLSDNIGELIRFAHLGGRSILNLSEILTS